MKDASLTLAELRIELSREVAVGRSAETKLTALTATEAEELIVRCGHHSVVLSTANKRYGRPCVRCHQRSGLGAVSCVAQSQTAVGATTPHKDLPIAEEKGRVRLATTH